MTDQLTKVLAYKDQVRIVIAETQHLVNQAHLKHETWHTSTAALGRTLTGTLLLASNLKGEDRLSVTIKGNGPLGTLFADADAKGNIRGFVENSNVALELNNQGKIDVSRGVGLPGSLTVKKFIENYEPFAGQVELVSGELAEDFTYYMAVSEQTPSSFGLSVLINPDEDVQSAGGFMVQLMPGASEETIQSLEDAISKVGKLSDYFNQDNPVNSLLAVLCPDKEYKIIDTKEIQFKCSCHRERFEIGLAMLDNADLMEIINDHQGAELRCHFCNQTYQFTDEEMQAIMSKKEKGGYNV